MKQPTSRNGAPRIRRRKASGRRRTARAVATDACTLRGAPRNSTAWIGRQTSNCSAASTHSAPRQPSRLISQAVSGMNTVLASPPRKVIVMMARRKSSGKRRVTTANTGVYRVADIATPSPIQTT